MKILSSLALASIAATALQAQVTLPFTDDFSYADGNLTDSAAWANHSGTGSFVQVSSGAAILVQGSGSREDVNVAFDFALGAGQAITYMFDVTVSGASPATDVYFAHFKDAGTGFNARAFVAAPVDGGDFTFGISDTASSPDVTFTTDFSYGVTYSLKGTYDFDTGLSTLSVNNGIAIASTTADIGQSMSAFALRQAGGNTSMEIDNLVIVIPEPSAFALLGGMVGLGVVLIRRRR